MALTENDKSILGKLNLSSDDFTWLSARVASNLISDSKQPSLFTQAITEEDLGALTKVVKARLSNADQLEMLSQLVSNHIRTLALLGCSTSNPHCACATKTGA